MTREGEALPVVVFFTDGDAPHYVTLGLDPRVQGNNSLFWRGAQGRGSGISVPGSSLS